VRGKGSSARELPARKKQGIGWTHSNMMQTAFGPFHPRHALRHRRRSYGRSGYERPRPASISLMARRQNISSSATSARLMGAPVEGCPREFLRCVASILREIFDHCHLGWARNASSRRRILDDAGRGSRMKLRLRRCLRRTDNSVLHVDDQERGAPFHDRPVAGEGLIRHGHGFPASWPQQQAPAETSVSPW
jgi:hypothetical protein